MASAKDLLFIDTSDQEVNLTSPPSPSPTLPSYENYNLDFVDVSDVNEDDVDVSDDNEDDMYLVYNLDHDTNSDSNLKSVTHSYQDIYEIDDILCQLYRQNDLYNHPLENSAKILMENLAHVLLLRRYWENSRVLMNIEKNLLLDNTCKVFCESVITSEFLNFADKENLLSLIQEWIKTK